MSLDDEKKVNQQLLPGKRFTAIAPAKIMVLGEYVVLDGAPAIVMAFDRYAKVSLQTTSGDYCRFESPHWQAAALLKLTSDGVVAWHPSSQELKNQYGLVADIVLAIHQMGLIDAESPVFNASLDTFDFFLGGGLAATKLGLGSSAALTVSLTAALANYCGSGALIQDKTSWLKQLLLIHRRYQNNQGSGADLAASFYGGVIIYHLEKESLTPQVQAVAWPAELHYLCIWSGKAAKTTEYVRRFYAWKEAEPKVASKLLDELHHIAIGAATELRQANTPAVLEYIDQYTQVLKQISFRSDIAIFSPQHQHLEALARTAGVMYKSCGAGGGDIGMAFSDDLEHLQRLQKKLISSGFVVVDGQIDLNGLRMEVKSW